MSLGLSRLSRIAFPSTFDTVCFLITLLLPKETIPTKKLTKQRKYKNDLKDSPVFYILRHYLLIILLVSLFIIIFYYLLFVLLFIKNQSEDTSISYNNSKSSNFFQ